MIIFNKKGFTLIELLIVIGIIVVLSSGLLIAINPSLQTAGARNNQREAHVNAVYNGFVQYEAREGQFPDCVPLGGEDPVDISQCEQELLDYLAKIPEDPSDDCSGTGYVVQRSVTGDVGVRAECAEGENKLIVAGSWDEGDIVSKPAVSTLPAENITDTSAILVGEVTHNGWTDLTERGLCYNTSGAPELGTDTCFTDSDAKMGEYEKEITGLTKDQFYYFRAYAINSEGTSYGQERGFVARTEAIEISCEVAADTTGIEMFRFDSLTNGHAEMPREGDYEYGVYCESSQSLNNDCSHANSDVMIKLSDLTNAHVETGDYNNYSNEVCIGSSDRQIKCDYAPSCDDLAGNYEPIISISSETNAHVAEPGYYDTQVCCTGDF